MFDVIDLPEAVVIQWSSQVVVPWVWLTKVNESGNRMSLSIKHKILLSQKSINSAPNTDVDCISALKLPQIKIYGVLAESMMHCSLLK